MSEYEYASLFVDFLEASNVVFANFMALTFAMLTASHFIAARLTRTMSLMLVAIYSLWSLNLMFGVYGAFSDFANLGLAIHELGQVPDTSLGWLGPASSGDAINYMKVMPDMMLGMSLVVYIVSVVFFYLARRGGVDTPESGA